MALSENPNLALIPTGYKAGKIYSVLPTTGVGDFDFARGTIATRINSSGLIEEVASNVPRLNYPLIDGVVKGCPHHILEPQRTNLVQYSEAFDNSYWNKTNSSVVSNTIISPDGTLNASKLKENVSNGNHNIYNNDVSVTLGSEYTFSLYVKKAERSIIKIDGGYRLTLGATFNLDTLDVTGDGTIEHFKDDWYKISTNGVGEVSNGGTNIFIFLLNDDGTQSYQGDGTSGVYIYGAMLENGSYPTSYIPNYGTAAGVTRSAETANGSGDAATFNDSEGVLFVEVSKDKGTQYSLISLQKSSVSDTYAYIGYLNNNTTIRGQIKVGGTIVLDEEIEMSDTSIVAKILIKYKSGDYSMWVNGFEVGSNTNSTIFSDGDLNEIELGINNNNGLRFYGKTKQLQYYDTALNSEDLEKLTSWVSFTDMAEGQLYTIE